MNREQYNLCAQGPDIFRNGRPQKVKNINLHIRNDGNLFISAFAPCALGVYRSLLTKKERPYLPSRPKDAGTAAKFSLPDTE